MRFNQEDMPRGRGRYIKCGLSIPRPTGEIWREALRERGITRGANKMNIIENNQCILDTVRAMHTGMAMSPKANSNHEIPEMHAHAAKKRRMKAIDAISGKIAPRNIAKAINGKDEEENQKWKQSINDEWAGITRMGTLEGGFTREALRQMGIHMEPVPFSQCLSFKYDGAGNINRYKTRLALSGHKGRLRKGIEYNGSTHASTPTIATTRIMQAIMVKFQMERLSFDISQAYLHAHIPDDQKIPVRSPDGLREYNDQGEEYFSILRKALYGHPLSANLWEKERNQSLKSLFSKAPWKMYNTSRDPSLFIIDKILTKEQKDSKQFEDKLLPNHRNAIRVLITIWTDDVDMISKCAETMKQVYQIIDNKYKSKIVPSDYILGVNREVSRGPGGSMKCDLSMVSFIEGMAQSFKEYIWDKKKATTPLPPGTFLHRDPKTTEEESTRIKERGSQQLFGQQLWSARNCFPETLLATSMIGRTLAHPDESSWDAQIHLLNYLWQHRTSSISYNSDDQSNPVAYSDASNKCDPTDGKSQYGYLITFLGGAVIASSKKNKHASGSVAANEFQASAWAARAVIWFRYLLYEIGKETHQKPDLSGELEQQEVDEGHDTMQLEDNSFRDILNMPTTLLADNRASNLWGTDLISSEANQYVRTSYFISREAISEGFLTIQYIPTRLNLSDAMTKALDRCTFERLVPVILGHIGTDSLHEEEELRIKTAAGIGAHGEKSEEVDKEE